MQRFAPYLGIIAAFGFFVLFIVFANQATILQTPTPTVPTASSTISVEPVVLPPLTLPTVESIASTTPVPNQKTAAPASKPVTTSVPAVALVPAPPPPVSGAALDAAASSLRSALVNIICYAPAGSGVHSISGSGVFIDPQGIILTNAHVALLFLLADRSVSCTIRSGSPATDSYEAALIHFPAAWIKANEDILTKTRPRGTGEYDFALLAVMKSVNKKALPHPFPFISLATTPPNPGTPIVIASYGAQFLESSQIQFALFPTIVFGSVKEVLTFATTTIDVLGLGGSAAAQEGSSGGGVADATGQLVGTITTSTVEGTTDTRSLDAITASYIRSAYASETGEALDLLLAKPTSTAIADFAPHIPALEAIITAGLP